LGILLIYPRFLSAEQNNAVDSMLLKLEADISTEKKAELMIQIAREYYYSDIPEAIRFANQAQELFRQNDNLPGIGQSINIVGAGYYALGNFSSAESHFLEALKIARETDDTVLTSKILNNLGNIKLNTGQLESAIDYFLEAGKIFVQNNNMYGAVSVEISLSSIYRSIGSFSKAHEHLDIALSFAEEIQNHRLLGTVNHNLGALLYDEKRYDEAYDASIKSYSHRLEGGHLAGQIKSLINLGSILRKTGNVLESDTCYKKALLLSEKHGYTEDEAYIHMHIGFTHLENKDYTSATGYFTNSMELAENLGDLELQLQLHNYLFYIDSIQGNFETALAHFKQYNKIKSNFDISDSEEKLEKLENLYALTKEDNELKETIIRKNRSLINCLIAGLIILILLTILFIQQVLLRSQRKIAELSQENLRSQMNPHFIFNILNSIHSFLLNNDSKSSGKYLLKFSHLLRLTLDNSSSKLASINDEIEALKLYLELESVRFNNQLEYEIIVDNEIDPLMFKIPPLLLQPYVENSVVHGLQNKKGKGKIEIRLDYKNKGIHCSITDNGIGRRKAEELKREKGIKHISHGSKIAETRLQLLNKIYGRKIGVSYTDIVDENNNCKGTIVEFNLPILN
jgi:tetratricopeptide (TPR) repeat protein